MKNKKNELPRGFLWADLKNFDELFDEPTGEEIYELYKELRNGRYSHNYKVVKAYYQAVNDGCVTETGTGIAKILPPTNPFLPESGEKKQTVIDRLKLFLQKFMSTTEQVNVNVTIENHFDGKISQLTINGQ